MINFTGSEYDSKANGFLLLISGDWRYVKLLKLEYSNLSDEEEDNLWVEKWQSKYPSSKPDFEIHVPEGTAAFAIRKDNVLLSENDWDWYEKVCDSGNDFTVDFNLILTIFTSSTMRCLA